MFKCDNCPSVFNAKRNLLTHKKTHLRIQFPCTICTTTFKYKSDLNRHQKTHTGIRFPCTICPTTFKYKSHLNRHHKNVHGIINVPAHRQPAAREDIQIAPQITVPDIPAGGSNMLSDE